MNKKIPNNVFQSPFVYCGLNPGWDSGISSRLSYFMNMCIWIRAPSIFRGIYISWDKPCTMLDVGYMMHASLATPSLAHALSRSAQSDAGPSDQLFMQRLAASTMWHRTQDSYHRNNINSTALTSQVRCYAHFCHML